MAARRRLLALAALVAAVVGLAPAAVAAPADRRLVLVTLDGVSWTEVFRGASPERAADRAFAVEGALIKKDFVDTPDRAAALMPFLHGVVAKQGVLIGDRDHGSCMAVSNDQWFSYPGYNEILTGKADPAIRSNEHGLNANVTMLEWLNRRPDFRGKVEAVASWANFREILAAKRSGVPVDAGWEGLGDGRVDPLETHAPHLWPTVRLDTFTHARALRALKTRKPKVLYVAYGETDDFAHEGHYDQVLWAARRTDAMLAELWAALQADRTYAGKTTLIITTDHGRGTQNRESWRHHGTPFVGSNATWLAAIGPAVVAPPASSDCASTRQVAATALTALGVDWRAFDPAIGEPMPILKGAR